VIETFNPPYSNGARIFRRSTASRRESCLAVFGATLRVAHYRSAEGAHASLLAFR
jgi:hypothetical protein